MTSNAQPCSRRAKAVFSHWLILICLLSLTALSHATDQAAAPSPNLTPKHRDALEYFFHQSFMNLEEEAEIAREEGQSGLLIMFNDPDCPWCHKMKATILSQPCLQEYFRKHFRAIHLDTKGDTLMVNFNGTEMTEKDYAFKLHRVRATPVFMFFDLEGNKLLRYTGATRNMEEFMWMGEYVVNKEFKNKKFAKYKRERLAELKN